MLSFFPWHKSTLEVSNKLRGWAEKSIPWELTLLDPEDWFHRDHDLNGGDPDCRGFWRNIITPGNFVWSPPPVAAQVALEQLMKARLKTELHPHSGYP